MISDDIWSIGLTSKQQNLIIEYYMAGGRLKPELWKKAGYQNGKGVRTWLRSLKARTALRMYAEMQIDMSRDFVKSKALKIIMQRSFYNVTDIIDHDGNLLSVYRDNLKKLGDLGYCVDGIEVHTNKMGNKEIKIKLANRTENVKLLAELFDFRGETDDNEIDGRKSIYDMNDEERQKEIKQLIRKLGFKKMKKIEEK